MSRWYIAVVAIGTVALTVGMDWSGVNADVRKDLVTEYWQILLFISVLVLAYAFWALKKSRK